MRSQPALVITMLLVTILLSCGGGNSPYADIHKGTIDVSVVDTVIYRMIPLETSERSLLKDIDYVLIDSGYIFVLDNSTFKSVFIYDMEGRFINSVGQQGRGPEEFARHITLDLDRARKELIVYDDGQKRLLRFSYNGEFIREIKFDNYPGDDFCYLGDDLYAFMTAVFEEQPDRNSVRIIREDGTVIGGYTPVPRRHANTLFAIENAYFCKMPDNSAYYIPLWTDRIYHLTADGPQEVFNFSLADKMATSSHEGSKFQRGEATGQYGFFSGLFVTEEGHYILNGMYDWSPFTVIGDLKTGKATGGSLAFNDMRVRRNLHLFEVPIGTHEEFLITSLSAKNAIYLFPDRTVGVEATDNPLLIFYKISP
jgi:hypothetical protein